MWNTRQGLDLGEWCLIQKNIKKITFLTLKLNFSFASTCTVIHANANALCRASLVMAVLMVTSAQADWLAMMLHPQQEVFLPSNQ